MTACVLYQIAAYMQAVSPCCSQTSTIQKDAKPAPSIELIHHHAAAMTTLHAVLSMMSLASQQCMSAGVALVHSMRAQLPSEAMLSSAGRCWSSC